jgi:hypothetical protein
MSNVFVASFRRTLAAVGICASAALGFSTVGMATVADAASPRWATTISVSCSPNDYGRVVVTLLDRQSDGNKVLITDQVNCGSSRTFYTLFKPDNAQLVLHSTGWNSRCASVNVLALPDTVQLPCHNSFISTLIGVPVQP